MCAQPAVQRIGGFDAIFFHTGTSQAHQHILLTYLFEPHPALTYENVVAGVVSRADLLPPLRMQTVHVPFSLHHPVRVAQPEIDIDQHFHRTHLGGTGTRRDLDEVMGTVASTPLDPDHPLWEMHFVEGLENGRAALIVKLHHSLADGAVVTTLLANVADLPAETTRPPIERQEATADLPGKLSLILTALRDIALGLIGSPALIFRTIRSTIAVARYKRRHRPSLPRPVLDSPRVSFHGTLTARRTIATTDIEMSQIKAIRAQHPGTTVNDVLLGVVSGVLRRWLAAHDEVPKRSLITSIPIGADEPGAEPRLVGNNLSNLVTTLATDVDDPAERLLAISTSMRHAREIERLRGSKNMEDWLRIVPGGLISLTGRLLTALGMPDRVPPPFTLQISNTPGPRQPIRIGGAQVYSARTTGPLLQGNGLGVIAYSYNDRMNLTMFACPDLLADVNELASYIPHALADYDTLGS